MPFLRQHRVATAVSVVAAAVAGTLVALALSSDGYETRHVNLNDGGIWVTSSPQLGLWGRLNKPAGALDLALSPPGRAQTTYRLDIRQQDSAVVGWDVGGGTLYPIDPASGKRIENQEVPVSSDEQVEIGGGTIAVLDPKTNRVWASRVDTDQGISSLSTLDSSAKPVVKLPAPADGGSAQSAGLAVGSDGTIYAVTARGDVATVHPDGDAFGKAKLGTLGQQLGSVQVSAVGPSMVVYDAAKGQLHLPGGRTAAVGADSDGRLQAVSDSGSQVIVATTKQLFTVPLGGGKATSLFAGGSGQPAAPTWLGDCVHSAWAGNPGVYARSCGGAPAKPIPVTNSKALIDPVFRVNRGAILLNDLTLGNVYDLATLQEVDDWSAVKPPPVVRQSKKNKNNTTALAARDLPPQANDDSPGARPGRTTVLHVLDNDSDPSGAVLAVTRLSSIDSTTANVQIAPDGQSVEISLPPDQSRNVHFSYTIDDGKGLTDSASVNVEIRQPNQNSAPRKRPKFAQPSFGVSSGGTLEIPVLDDWRDLDGDPLVVTKATTSAGNVTVTPDGRLNFLAPPTGGTPKLTYEVSDGRAEAQKQSVPITVLGPTSTKTSPPIAQPDIARGEVGKPIRVKPLGNDLPGADPTNPNAELAIAGSIASPAGVRVSTDLKSGTVTVVAARHGTVVLNYTAAYGNAKFGHSIIRVDVANVPAQPQPPVAVPDTGVLYGQNPATIDVVANDFDPAGGVLVVQHAEPLVDNGQLQVAIVGGRFLRVNTRQADLTPNPQVVRYTITDGLTHPVTGELTVTQQPPPEVDTPLAVDDYVTVRSGDSALIPVLDNDIDPAGAALGLLDDVPGAPRPGQLSVASGDDSHRADLGAAFVSGKLVRYVAPVVAQPASTTVAYVARNPAGDRGAGTVHVTVEPPPSKTNPDQAPTAQALESRVVGGDTIRITIPTTNIDPDGDTANVTGITSAPKLGRIVAIGSTSITYEAFPTESGTDRFGYQVTDPYGLTSTSTVSIGVGPASDPQPPVAVDDTPTAAPGAKLRIDVLANDVIAPDDSVSITKLRTTNPELPSGIKLVREGGPIEVVAPRTNGRDLVFQYAVNDGAGDPSIATVKVHSQRGYVAPPLVVDVPATPAPNAATASVDVLAKASDPQGAQLRIAKVFSRTAAIVGGKVQVPVIARVQNIVYEVANAAGGTAAAVIHVPARGVGAPYGKAGTLIRVARNGTKTIDIGAFVTDPAAKPVRLTTTDHLATAPATDLTLTSPDTTHLKIASRNGYNGPAAITFQVTDGRRLDDPDGRLALITVQVQVGDPTPVVRCPTAPIPVVEGGDTRRLDITALCHVWTPDRSQLSGLGYVATWKSHPRGVDILGSGSHVVGLQAGGAARPGAEGSISVTVAGAKALPSTIYVTVKKLGPASIEPIVIDGFKAGSTATRDLRGYVNSPLSDPHVSVVALSHVSGPTARTSVNGSSVSITPGSSTHGLIRFSVTVTDVADRSRTDRRVSGTIELHVLNVPDAPGSVQSGRTTLSQTAIVSWSTPNANGAQIDSYQVRWSGSAQSCSASPCRITGLRNGTRYPFTVRAHNSVGYSKSSRPLSPPARPDKRPAAVAQLTTSDPQDGRLRISWRPVDNGSSKIVGYQVNWTGGGAQSVAPSRTSIVATGLDNHNRYTFTVTARNQLGAGPPNSVQGQSAGNPGTPTGVAVDYATAAGTSTRTVTVHWNGVDPNGAGQPSYTVTRDGARICTTTATSCTDTPASAHTYQYDVQAANQVGHQSGVGSTQFAVAGTPDAPAGVRPTHTATDGQLNVAYTVPNSYGQESTIHCSASPGGSCGTWTPGAAAGSGDTHLVSGLPADTDVTITLQDCNAQQCGGNGSGVGHTSGLPHTPTGGSCGRSGDTVTWNWGQPTAVNGYQVTKYQITLDGNTSTVTTSQHSKSEPADGQDRTLTVKSIDSRGEVGNNANSITCSDAPVPTPPKVTVVPGAWTNSVQGCTNVGCHAVAVTLANFNPGDRVTFYRTWTPSTDNGAPGGYLTVTIGSDGGWQGVDGYYGGGNAGGNGTGTVSIYVTGGGPEDHCYSDWHVQSDYTCN